MCSLKAKLTQLQPISGGDIIKYQPLKKKKDNYILSVHVVYLAPILVLFDGSEGHKVLCAAAVYINISRSSLLSPNMYQTCCLCNHRH